MQEVVVEAVVTHDMSWHCQFALACSLVLSLRKPQVVSVASALLDVVFTKSTFHGSPPLARVQVVEHIKHRFFNVDFQRGVGASEAIGYGFRIEANAPHSTNMRISHLLQFSLSEVIVKHQANQPVLGCGEWQKALVKVVVNVTHATPPLVRIADTPCFGIEFSKIGLVGVTPVVTEYAPVEQNTLLVANDIPLVAVVAYKCYTKSVTAQSYQRCRHGITP